LTWRIYPCHPPNVISLPRLACLPIALTVSAMFMAASANAHPADRSEAATNQSVVDDSGVSTVNLDLVNELDEAGQCLFRNDVFPAGGVGYKDSSLPYDLYSEEGAAVATYRAEIIRHFGRQIGGVSIRQNQAGEQAVSVSFLSGTDDVQIARYFTELRTESEPFASSESYMRSRGIDAIVATTARSDIFTACVAQNQLMAPDFGDLADIPESVGIESFRDDATGLLQIVVPRAYVANVSRAMAAFSGAIAVSGTDAKVSFQGRGDSYTPRRGGSHLYSGQPSCANCDRCSDAFRVNTTSLLTAAHCDDPNWYSYNQGTFAGTIASSLASANVDAQVLTGSGAGYSRQIWVGGAAGSGTLPGQNYVPASSVSVGGQYLFSGGESGQGTISIFAKPSPTNCFSQGGYTACQLYKGLSSDPICVGGDSGSPAALYDPGTGKLAALGVHSAGGPDGNGNRVCFETSAEVIVYLYGGATIG
jgi:hypothetical protein